MPHLVEYFPILRLLTRLMSFKNIRFRLGDKDIFISISSPRS